ncbi:MAG: DEAD/DEAH box helicase [Myxococcota bacterium]
MGLAPELMTALGDMGFTEPTPIQTKAIPLAVQGRDLVASASTGTGKTAAFLLPILHQLRGTEPGKPRVLVLSPTRELALQIDEQALALGYHLGFSSIAVVGGVNMGPQEWAIRQGAEIIVATPGRLLDHLRFPHLDPSTISHLVIDEADRMFDMGFLPTSSASSPACPPSGRRCCSRPRCRPRSASWRSRSSATPRRWPSTARSRPRAWCSARSPWGTTARRRCSRSCWRTPRSRPSSCS